MRDTLGNSLKNLKWLRILKIRVSAILLVLSLIVSFDVFYALRQPGLTLAGDASCGIVEHKHDEACYTLECTCQLVYEPHKHEEACFETRHVEAQEISHVICGLGEIPHDHSDECYVTITGEPVIESIQICEITDEEHIHDDGCYETTELPGSEESVLNCELIYEPHEHSEDCYMVELIEAYDEEVEICTPEEIEHIHNDECYEQKLRCDLEEHSHSIECYSDETADVESMLDWQNMFAAYPYTGDLRSDLSGIALTQVGYSESSLNFEQDENGIRRGYTRYGAWYGMPYGDWSAMFVSFCLSYAGADPAENPFNTGAYSMIQHWDNLGKYKAFGEYEPVNGDLVFFDNNTVGIVIEVYEGSCYIVRGDVDNAVCTQLLSIADPSIIGWGITVMDEPMLEEEAEDEPELDQVEDEAETEPELDQVEDETPQENAEVGYFELFTEELLDISNGPAMFIFANGKHEQQMQVYSLRMARSYTDLLTYLNDNGGGFFYTLLDRYNHELPKDGQGNYIVQPDTAYKLTITFTNPMGFTPSVYQFQVPNGLLVDGGEGSFILKDGENVGSWTVTNEGLITMDFNEHINSRTDITISSTLGIHFPQSEEPFDFDGKITVIVEKPQEEVHATKVNKWGSQGNPAMDKNDPSKIYWTILITGHEDSQIPGSLLTDQVLNHDWSYDHGYSQSDMEAGIFFGVSKEPEDENEEASWHRWVVKPDSPNMTWDEDGWSYQMPETVTCEICGNEIALGNDGWSYYVEYTSTPAATNLAGGLAYANRVEIDNQNAEGWASFTQTEVHGDIFKNGRFVSDAEGGKFIWDLQVTIPGRKAGEKSATNWFINDIMTIRDVNGNVVSYAPNDLNLATVTANYQGKTINVPRIQDATDNDPYVWMLGWSKDQGNNGFYDLRQFNILCRCSCTEESCGVGNCWTYGYWRDDHTWEDYSEYCPCWTETEDTTFTFTYQTKDMSYISNYFGTGYSLHNEVLLAKDNSPEVGTAHAAAPLPNVLSKELTHDFDGYTAHYNVTVNESKVLLTDGSPLYIHDVMTDTLAFISGSLVITTEDAMGNVSTLKQGTDYSVAYDGSGWQVDENGKKVHVLDIIITHPQPVMYILDYDATLIIPEHVSEGVKYSNSATISLWGTNIKDTTDEKVYAEFNMAANNYQVEIFKTCASSGEALSGAVFGLYNQNGGLITSAMTDNNGKLIFQSNIVQGIVLREHLLYYIQELRAPDGYKLDDTKFWFCFCNQKLESCEKCDETIAGTDAKRIPLEELGNINISNEFMKYSLPATGGTGVYPLMIASLMFVVTPIAYSFILRCKRERRGNI